MTEVESKVARLEGRVAQILNAREVVINIGSAQGVKRAMRFAILAETPVEVVDPLTNEVLDTIDREKVRVEVSEVRERISICRTFRTRTIGGQSGIMGAYMREFIEAQKMYQYEPPRKVVETLRVEDSQLPPPLEEDESYVKVNDRVIQIADADDETSARVQVPAG
jgi:hypothetical protein